jgi:hypothetical protein
VSDRCALGASRGDQALDGKKYRSALFASGFIDEAIAGRSKSREPPNSLEALLEESENVGAAPKP